MGAEHKPALENAEVYQPDTRLEDVQSDAHKTLVTAKEFIDRVHAERDAEQYTPEVEAKLLEIAENLEKSIEQWQMLSNALAQANKELPAEIEQLKLADKKILNTEYVDKTGPDFRKNVEQISPEMRQAIKIVNSGMRGAEFPHWIFGSTAFVLQANEKTGKKPSDIDMAAAAQDFPIVYQNFKELAASGQVVNLEILEMTNMKGEKNNCFELKGKTRTDDGTLHEFSIFFQNINPNEARNGRVNIGIEQTLADIYDIDGEPVNFAGPETNNIMYARSLLYEIGLFNYKTFAEGKKSFPQLTAKMLQRWSNLMVTHDYDHAKVMTDIEACINEENKDALGETLEMLKKINKEYDERQMQGEGLTSTICKEAAIDERCEEGSVDAITEEIKEHMEIASNLVLQADSIFANPDPEMTINLKIGALTEIDNKITEMYHGYENRLRLINKSNENDRIMYAAMRSMEHHFLFEIVLHLARLKSELELEMSN